MRSAEPGQTITGPIGSPIYVWQRGIKINNGASRHELTYQGVDKDTIALGYTEYAWMNMGWFARQAFAQPLKYDLSKSKEITFRELKMSVGQADNNAITATIIQAPSID